MCNSNSKMKVASQRTSAQDHDGTSGNGQGEAGWWHLGPASWQYCTRLWPYIEIMLPERCIQC